MGPHSGNRSRPAYSGQARYVMPQLIRSMFKPRPALPYIPPPRRHSLPSYTPISLFLTHLKHSTPSNPPPTVQQDNKSTIPFETPAQCRAKRKHIRIESSKKRKAEQLIKFKQQMNHYNKHSQNQTEQEEHKHYTNDPHKTLFVAGLSTETTDLKLRKELEVYGNIIQIVRPQRALLKCMLLEVVECLDQNANCSQEYFVPCSYAFVEFEDERDVSEACRRGNGRKLDGKFVVMDKERARIQDGFLPKRLLDPGCTQNLEQERNHHHQQQQQLPRHRFHQTNRSVPDFRHDRRRPGPPHSHRFQTNKR
uniref:RRM domain-containing protein n=1 Tax=Timspurckia oligopyrenoides TaxID=708627 RepID=A0A7S0ZHQ1_9RHOD